jgi:hypothetical protein
MRIGSLLTRRHFLKVLVWLAAATGIPLRTGGAQQPFPPPTRTPVTSVCRALNGRPAENLDKVLELLGGIDSLVGLDDVVAIKPNVQWWNQGAPNLAATMKLVERIIERPGFRGEVILVENCHRGPKPWESDHSGWKPKFTINADLDGVSNYNELGAVLSKRYPGRFSVCHWINVAAGAKRVFSPADGPGYVYCDGSGGVPRLAFANGLKGEHARATIMTYPVFPTAAKGRLVDYKHGIWEGGAYTGQPFKYINLAALNHHSSYCGITSCVKNYLGVTDLSGGPDPFDGGRLDSVHYNFHSFPFNKWTPGPAPGMIGAEIGVFLETIRRPDLNIVTAEWVGLSSRTEGPVVRTRTVLASPDPVALDYHSAKYLLYPNSGIRIHDPDYPASPTRQYLQACARHAGGVFDESRVGVKSYDLAAGRLQREDELIVKSDKQWGRDPKPILKYLMFRYGSFLL